MNFEYDDKKNEVDVNDDDEKECDEFHDRMLKEWLLPPENEEVKKLADELDHKEKENIDLKKKIHEKEIEAKEKSVMLECGENKIIGA